MKKDNNILYFGMFFAASILAEIYCIINSINIIGVSIVVVIATYLLLDAIQTERVKEREYWKTYLETRVDEIEKVEKALYMQSKKTAELVELQLEGIRREQKENVSTMIENQNKVAKVVVKYIRDDMKKTSAIHKAGSEKIVSVLHQGTDKLLEQMEKSSFDDKDLLNTIDASFTTLVDKMEGRLREIEKECVRIEQLTDMIHVDMRNPMMHAQPSVIPISYTNVETQNTGQPSSFELDTPKKTDTKLDDEKEEPVLQTIEEEQELLSKEEFQKEKEIPIEAEPVIEEEPVVAAVNKASTEANEPSNQLSADEIAALFAAAEQETKESEEIESSEPEIEVKEEADDPNRQLSADEIAAMFAAVNNDVAEQEEKEPVSMSSAVPTTSEDSNKQLSPEEIATLFASMG
ncbi:MAG: hypothetical protein PWP24_714 [Clostridiales bacterium]|nr:hypothetical protein [Clostridiales bacterium]